MAMFTLQFNVTEAQAAYRQLGTRAPIAIARALNRAGGSMATAMARSVSKDTKLKVGTVKAKLQLTKATESRQAIQLSVSGARIPVVDFNARGPEPSRGRGRGVTANTPAHRYPHAFLATMPSGHRGVFERIIGKYMRRVGPRGGRKQAIRELFGPSLPHVFNKFTRSTLARGEEQLKKNLVSEMRFLLRH